MFSSLHVVLVFFFVGLFFLLVLSSAGPNYNFLVCKPNKLKISAKFKQFSGILTILYEYAHHQ